MPQHDTRNRDAECARVGVGRQTKAAVGSCSWRKITSCSGPDQRSPRAHPPLQRAPNAGANLGMAPTDFFEHRNRPDTGARLQDRAISSSQTSANGSSRRRHNPLSSAMAGADHPQIPVAGCRAEAGLGGSNGGIVDLSVTHVQPHLVVGDVEAGQCLFPQRLRPDQNLDPATAHDPQDGFQKPAAEAGPPSVSLRPPSVSASPGAYLILIDALSHLDCRRAKWS